MSFKEKQIKNSLLYIVPIIVLTFIPFLTMPIYTRILTPEDYGVYALTTIYAVFMVGLSNFGLSIAYERNYFEYKENIQSGALFFTIIVFVISALLFCSIITFIFRFQLAGWITGSKRYGNLLFWNLCANGLVSLKMYFLLYYKNEEKPKNYIIINIIEGISILIATFLFIVVIRTGVIGLVWGQFFPELFLLIYMIIRIKRNLPFSIKLKLLKESLKLSFPLTPKIFLTIFGSQFDKFMIGMLKTTGGVGIYSLAQRISNLIFTFTTALENVFNPHVYSLMFENTEDSPMEIGKYLTTFIYFSVFFGLGIALFSEELVYILMPNSYYGAIPIVIILALYYGSLFFGKIPQLVYSKKTNVIFILIIMRYALNVGINIPFIMLWGVKGAAFAVLLAGIISEIITFFVSQHYYKIKWEYGKILLIFLSFYLFSSIMLVSYELSISYITRLLVKICMFTLMLLIGNRLNIITKMNIGILKNIIILKKD